MTLRIITDGTPDEAPGTVIMPNHTIFGIADLLHIGKCEHDQEIQVVTATAIDHHTGNRATIGFSRPDGLAEHIAGLWATGVTHWGRVGFRAALERAVHDINTQQGEKLVDY